MVVAIVALLVWGGWAPTNERLILYIIAGSLAGFVVSMIAVILALAVGGPVGRFKMQAGREGATFDLSDHEPAATVTTTRSEEHTSELQSLMRISYAVFCLKKKNRTIVILLCVPTLLLILSTH